jgi:prophage tail gpP-like protein
MMKGSVIFASLIVTGESLTCTGSDDPSASVPFCYSGADLGETVDVKVDSFTNEAGTIDITGSGLESISCLGKSFSKSGQDLAVDLSDCVNDVQINSLQYCSDQDEIHATVSKSFIRVDVPLVRSSCSSVGATTCTGSEDPPSAVPFCYTGSKLGETVNLKVNSFDSEAGSFDLTGSGLESISCLGKSFSKSGQDLVADLSDCVSLASISKLEYCSDQDQIVATIKDGFISTNAVLTKVACDSMDEPSVV